MRRAAILALPKIDESRKTREALEELLGDADPHLRIDVARALGEIGDTKSRGPLRERLELDLDPRVRRRLRETLRDLGGDSKKVVDQMKEDLEKLQSEHASLRTRVALLEARAPAKDDGGASKAAPVKRATKAKAKKDGARAARSKSGNKR
jgi:aminopeptidase N